eukprot:3004470-Rhodomonas_salina.3
MFMVLVEQKTMGFFIAMCGSLGTTSQADRAGIVGMDRPDGRRGTWDRGSEMGAQGMWDVGCGMWDVDVGCGMHGS